MKFWTLKLTQPLAGLTSHHNFNCLNILWTTIWRKGNDDKEILKYSSKTESCVEELWFFNLGFSSNKSLNSPSLTILKLSTVCEWISPFISVTSLTWIRSYEFLANFYYASMWTRFLWSFVHFYDIIHKRPLLSNGYMRWEVALFRLGVALTWYCYKWTKLRCF